MGLIDKILHHKPWLEKFSIADNPGSPNSPWNAGRDLGGRLAGDLTTQDDGLINMRSQGSGDFSASREEGRSSYRANNMASAGIRNERHYENPWRSVFNPSSNPRMQGRSIYDVPKPNEATVHEMIMHSAESNQAARERKG